MARCDEDVKRDQQKALFNSAISTYAKWYAKEYDVPPAASHDVRDQIEQLLQDAAEKVVVDPESWPFVKTRFLYDIYLAKRLADGTTTDFDLVRPGLLIGHFDDPAEYHRHCLRVGESRKQETNYEKVCSTCNTLKPGSAFKHRGGAVCNSCRGKAYRQRVAAR